MNERLHPTSTDRPIDPIRAVLSLLNSGCILLAAAYLDVFIKSGPRWLRSTLAWLHARPWSALVGGGIIALIFVTTVVLILGKFRYIGNVPDFVMSITTLSILIIGLTKSFSERGFPWLARLSIAALLLQVFAQLPELDQNLTNSLGAFGSKPPEAWRLLQTVRWPIVLTSKVLVMNLFLALPFSWMHQMREQELAAAREETERSKAEIRAEMTDQIDLLKAQLIGGIDRSVRLTILSPRRQFESTVFPVRVGRSVSGEYSEQEVNLPPKPYLRLLELALIRCDEKNPSGKATVKDLFESGENKTRQDFQSLRNALGERNVEHVGIGSDDRGTRWIALPPDCIDIDFEGLRLWKPDPERHVSEFWSNLCRRFARLRSEGTITVTRS